MVKSPAATLGPSAFEPRQTPPAGGLCSTVALPLSEQFQGSFRAVSERFQISSVLIDTANFIH